MKKVCMIYYLLLFSMYRVNYYEDEKQFKIMGNIKWSRFYIQLLSWLMNKRCLPILSDIDYN